MIRIKRVYDPPSRTDGRRVLVERLWPRGIKKATLPLDVWAKAVAPSHALRRWFAHDPKKWPEFQRRYRAELDARPEDWQPLLAMARANAVTFLYSAHDTDHNSARVLRDYLERKLARVRS